MDHMKSIHNKSVKTLSMFSLYGKNNAQIDITESETVAICYNYMI